MKKSTHSVIVVCLTILLFPLVISENETIVNNSLEEGIAGLRDIANQSDIAFGTQVKEKASELAIAQIPLPEEIKPVLKILFRVENPSYSEALIMIALLIFFAAVFIDIMEAYSAFSKITSQSVGIIMAILFSMVGGIYGITLFLLGIGRGFAQFAGWSAGALWFWVIVIIAILIIGIGLMNRLKQYQLLRLAKRRGFRRGLQEAEAGVMTKTMEKIGSKLRS